MNSSHVVWSAWLSKAIIQKSMKTLDLAIWRRVVDRARDVWNLKFVEDQPLNLIAKFCTIVRKNCANARVCWNEMIKKQWSDSHCRFVPCCIDLGPTAEMITNCDSIFIAPCHSPEMDYMCQYQPSETGVQELACLAWEHVDFAYVETDKASS